MSSKRSVATQTFPNHTVERTSTLCITPNCLKTATESTQQPTFSMLKITCVQSIDYNLQLLPTMSQLSEEDTQKMDVVLSEGKLNVNFQQHFVNRIDGKLFTLNTKKENIVLKRLCRIEIWKQLGFSHIEPEPITKSRQFNKKYWLYASGSQCSAPYISRDRASQLPHGALTQLTFMLNWVTINDDVASLRQKLTMEKREQTSLEITAIDMAFRSLIKNLLLERYPLIFSLNYQEKLQSITKHIPIISKSIARIINSSPNDEFRSQAKKLVQETRNRVNLSFSLNQDIKEDPDLTSKRIRNILENGLYTIARDINVPAPPLIEHSSSEEEIIDSCIKARDAVKSRNLSDLKQEAKVARVVHDVPEVCYKTEDTSSMNLDDETIYSENFCEMIFESEDNESIFDTDDDLLIGEKTSDVEDDIESMFENEHEDNQNLIEEEFEHSSSSEDYENFWDEEDIEFLFGIKDNPTKTTYMDICNDYIAESSKEISCEEFNSLEDDVDLLDFGTLDEDMHDYSNADNLEGSPSFTKRHNSNNLAVMLPHSQQRSPFRDKTNISFQGQVIYNSEKNQVSEDTFFDTML